MKLDCLNRAVDNDRQIARFVSGQVTLADPCPDRSYGWEYVLRGIDRRHDHINRPALACWQDSVEQHSLGGYAARQGLLQHFLKELLGLPFG